MQLEDSLQFHCHFMPFQCMKMKVDAFYDAYHSLCERAGKLTCRAKGLPSERSAPFRARHLLPQEDWQGHGRIGEPIRIHSHPLPNPNRFGVGLDPMSHIGQPGTVDAQPVPSQGWV